VLDLVDPRAVGLVEHLEALQKVAGENQDAVKVRDRTMTEYSIASVPTL